MARSSWKGKFTLTSCAGHQRVLQAASGRVENRLQLFRRPSVEALSGAFIDLAALTFADGEHDDHNLVAIYSIHQPIAKFAQFDLVAVGHAGERRLRDARFLQAVFEHLE